MAEGLVRKTITVTRHQVDWVLSRSGCFSRYVRTLIDKEMGAEEARLVDVARSERMEQNKTPARALEWKMPGD